MKVNKKFINYWFKFLSWLSFFVSSIFLGYFVRDIWNDYQSGKTNDRIYSESRQHYEHPTISLCFEPEIKTTKLQDYNITVEEFHFIKDVDSKMIANFSVLPFVHDVRYKIGRDFTLLWKYYNGKKTYFHSIKSIDDLQQKLGKVILKELPLWDYGQCTVIQLNEKIQTPLRRYNILQVELTNQNAKIQPLLKVFFTSKENFYGAAILQWLDGERLALEIDPEQPSKHYINLQLTKRIQLKQVTNCSDFGFYECFTKK